MFLNRKWLSRFTRIIFLLLPISLIIYLTTKNDKIPNSPQNKTVAPSVEANSVQSFSTTVQCIGPRYNQSCLFKNLYYKNGAFWAFSLKQENFSLAGVRIDALATHDYYPKLKTFETEIELNNFVRLEIDPMKFWGLTVHFNPHWLRNIGHALFDGLYPAFVALIRFSPKHLQTFRLFVGLGNSNCEDCFSEDVFSRFAGNGLVKSNLIDSFFPARWFLFDELLMGSGMMCQRCIQSNYQLAAGVELDASRLFRDRMYRQHGIIPPLNRKNSRSSRDRTKPLKVFIIHNKRFTEDEQQEIRAALAEFNRTRGQNDPIKWPLIETNYLNYRDVKAQTDLMKNIQKTSIDARSPTYELVDNDFMAQLKMLRQMDIHITGPGTGQMYQTFLPDGSVTINLGGLNPYQKEKTPIAYPSFLEQYMTSGTPYIKGLYYPINKRRDGIQKDEVVQLIIQAAKLINDGFEIPVDPKENLAPDGKVFVDQCDRDEEFCQLVTIRKPGMFWCNNMWTEDLVHERRQWAEGGFIISGRNVTCSFNRTLLRSLRAKYSIEYRPGVE